MGGKIKYLECNTKKEDHIAISSINSTILQSFAGKVFLLLKTPAKPDFKLKPSSPIFNVRFYCNDGRFYYMYFKPFKCIPLKWEQSSFLL